MLSSISFVAIPTRQQFKLYEAKSGEDKYKLSLKSAVPLFNP